jgi:hypothetical protein
MNNDLILSKIFWAALWLLRNVSDIALERTGCLISRIWGSHGGEYEDGCLLGCSAV